MMLEMKMRFNCFSITAFEKNGNHRRRKKTFEASVWLQRTEFESSLSKTLKRNNSTQKAPQYLVSLSLSFLLSHSLSLSLTLSLTLTLSLILIISLTLSLILILSHSHSHSRSHSPLSRSLFHARLITRIVPDLENLFYKLSLFQTIALTLSVSFSDKINTLSRSHTHYFFFCLPLSLIQEP